jgi:hypothetical protein
MYIWDGTGAPPLRRLPEQPGGSNCVDRDFKVFRIDWGKIVYAKTWQDFRDFGRP